MTTLALLVGTAGLLALPALTHDIGLRLRPAEWAHLNALALVAGAVMFEAALIVCAAPTLAGMLGLPPSVTGSLHHFFPGGSAAGWVAIVGAGGLPLVAGRALVRERGPYRRIGSTVSADSEFEWEGWKVVVVASSETFAFAVPAPNPRIVVSTEVMDVLDDEQFSAVLRHEAAHLRLHHSRYLLLAAALRPLVGRLPVARTSLDVLELSTERWADEEAASTPEERAGVRGALLALAGMKLPHGITAFSRARGVIERLEALASPGMRSRGLVGVFPYALFGALTVLAMWSFVAFVQG